MTAAAAPSIRTYEERAVLAEYAKGKDLRDIGNANPKGGDWAAAVIMRVATMDRGRARAAVMAYDSRLATTARKDQPQPHTPAPAAAAAASTDKPTKATDAMPAMPPDIEALLKDAETCGLPKPATKAANIRGLITELQALMLASEQERTLRAFIKTLTEQRDKAIQELKELTGKPTAVAAAQPSREEYQLIRRWARDNGVKCPVSGRIPGSVVDAWRKANDGKPRAALDQAEKETR